MVSSTPSLSIKSMKHSFHKLCTPAQFYILTSLVGLLAYLVIMLEHKDKMKTSLGIALQTVIVLAWTCVLNWICKLKHGNTFAWFLVFFPFILFIIFLILLIYIVDKADLSSEDLHEIMDAEKDNKEDDIEGLNNSC
jgi:uncharacterized membrane protein